jgi:hypothetical protein
VLRPELGAIELGVVGFGHVGDPLRRDEAPINGSALGGDGHPAGAQ